MHSLRPIYLLIFLWVLGAGLAPGSKCAAKDLVAQDEDVLCIGTGPVVGANLALAKETAVANALTKGVEAYLLGRLGAKASAAHFQRLVQEILPRSREVVEYYNILGEEESGNQVQILVRLRVNKRVMDERLTSAGVLAAPVSSQTVLFLVWERRKGEVSYWWKDPDLSSAMTATDVALHKVFQEKGLVPMQRTIGPAVGDPSLKTGVPDLAYQDALNWGRALGADLVILGGTTIPPSGPVDIALKAAAVRDGQEVCQEERTFPADRVSGQEDALMGELVGMISEMASVLVPCMLQSVKGDEPTVTRLSVRLENLRSLREATAFRNFLSKNVSGVQSVKQTRMKKDSVSLEVEYKGSQENFLNQVLNHENPPFPLEPGDIGAGEIVLMAQ